MPNQSGLEELRVLSEKATQGEWRSDHDGFLPKDQETRVSIGAYIACINGLSAIFTLATLQMPDEAEEGMSDGIRNRERVYADAAFIVACVNYVRQHVLPLLGKGMGAAPEGTELSSTTASDAAALRASIPSAQWRPIRMAPRDGTLIFVARDMGEPWGWVRGVSRWDGAHGIYGWISRGLYDPPGELGLGHPDVWMPIPAPPSAVGDRQNARREAEVTLDTLAQMIEREAMAWRGVNGGIYTIHAMSLALAKLVFPLLWLPLDALGTEAACGRDRQGSVHDGPADLSATPTLPLPPRGRCPEGWEPIRTAPKDGTTLLLAWQEQGIWMMANGWFETGPADRCWYALWDTVVRPTHWMPMPCRPASPTPKEG